LKLVSRLISYLAAWLRRSRGRLWLPVHRAIARAYKAFRLALPSERTIHRIIAAMRSCGLFVFQGGRGRGNELLMALPGSVGAAFHFSVQKKVPIFPVYSSFQDSTASNSGGAGATGHVPPRETGGVAALERCGFALARQFCSTWWDNCKVQMPPVPVLAAAIVEKLRRGASAADILAALEQLLIRHHMLAVDHGLTSRTWSWSGLLADFRRMEFAGSPDTWYRADRAARAEIQDRIRESMGDGISM
jgi:hypothetical protein